MDKVLLYVLVIFVSLVIIGCTPGSSKGHGLEADIWNELDELYNERIGFMYYVEEGTQFRTNNTEENVVEIVRQDYYHVYFRDSEMLYGEAELLNSTQVFSESITAVTILVVEDGQLHIVIIMSQKPLSRDIEYKLRDIRAEDAISYVRYIIDRHKE